MRPSKVHVARAFRIVAAALLLAATACSGPGGDSAIPRELRDAIAEAFPDLEAYQLVRIDDSAIVADLRQHALGGDGGDTPLKVRLPMFDADGVLGEVDWLAYHVDVRRVLVDVPDTDEFTRFTPTGPSMTFRGTPDWSYEQTMAALSGIVSGDFDVTTVQPSTLALVGNHMAGANAGTGINYDVTVIEHLGNALQPHFGSVRSGELASLVAENYLVYVQSQYRAQLLHGEPHSDALSLSAPTSGSTTVVTPQVHTQVRELLPVMVADATVYDPSTDTWHVSNWFDRVDAVANRQDANLWLSNIAPDIPASKSDLATNNNRILVRTRVAGYMAMTLEGQALLAYPAANNVCGDEADSFINQIRLLSFDAAAPNEYWMWWTRQYGGGCAYIAALGLTPHRGAVGWSGYGDGTHDWTSFVFMHESGHILGGTHRTDDATSPETLPNHRCNLMGEIPFGPTGPSLMSYASGAFTFCFASTDASGEPKRNLTQVAEYLNTYLK